ncbi:helix-turn-helix transcriptional regulator [Paenibacillus pinihumi]|uniref:helix-turn-helix transcriptional regulator n=1 Tax=Paenibacillus pinihumi TaxID=669462 RepID=UPI000419C0C6|nr:AraC family transcriptional regulator [Paenibacillus pinihumi]
MNVPILRDSQLKLLWTARVDYPKKNAVLPHLHSDYFQLLLPLEGAGQIMIEDETLDITPNSYYLFKQNVTHSFSFTKNTITLDFKFVILDYNLLQWIETIPASGICGEGTIAEFKQWFKLSLQHMRKPNDILPFRVESGFKSSLFSLLQDDSHSNSEHHKRLLLSDFDMAQYLQDNLHHNITLNELARKFGYHPHYIINLFQEYTGMSPIQLLQKLRLEKAREYLEFTALSISEISEKVGLSLPYFSRLFRSKEGMSASAYREIIRTAIGKDLNLSGDFENTWLVTHG